MFICPEHGQPAAEQSAAAWLLLWFGGHSAGKTPDPIPNSAVKCQHANGTASQDVGE
jgi:hypothetical protein